MWAISIILHRNRTIYEITQLFLSWKECFLSLHADKDPVSVKAMEKMLI